jgi:hypothetical protein
VQLWERAPAKNCLILDISLWVREINSFIWFASNQTNYGMRYPWVREISSQMSLSISWFS